MCIDKPEVRPGLDGIVDYIDAIQRIQAKLSPILTLLDFASEINFKIGAVLTNEDLGNLGGLLQDMLNEVWQSAEDIYQIYRKEVESCKQ